MTRPLRLYMSAADLRGHVTDFDAVICDPPYSPEVHDRAVSNNPGGVETGTRKRDFKFAPLDAALLGEIGGMIASARRWSCIFSDIESVGAIWKPLLCEYYVRSVPWVRWSQPQKSGDRPGSGCEMVIHAHAPGKKRWNGPGGLTHYWVKCMRGAEKHDAQKPLDLMLALVSWYSDPGELVIDPTMGSGTTGVACELLGREFAGAELDAGWRAHAGIRIADARVDRLSDGDRERAERFVTDMIERYETEVTSTPKALERRERGLADVARLAERLQL